MKIDRFVPFLFLVPLAIASASGGGRSSLIAAAPAAPAASATPAAPAAPAAADCSTITAENTDDCVRLNQVQLLGTHNSYHLEPKPKVIEALGGRGAALQYTHKPLTEQLSRLGIRQFELDIHADPDGGRYANASAFTLTGDVPDPALKKPGFKILHAQDIDVRSTCPTLVACLTEIKTWSAANPGHLPVMIMIEAKDGGVRARPGVEAVAPLPIGAKEFAALDAEIRSVFSPAQLITPDSVRGGAATLAEAIRTQGWPTLKASRGKVLFALDNTDTHRDEYLAGHPSLRGRVLFVTAPDADEASAFLKLNEARGPAEARIRERVAAGFLVRTRADEPGQEARSGDTTRRDSAFRSGAQYVSTDYPEVSPYGSGYIARLPGTGAARVARCNPVAAPKGCRDEWLEPRRGR